jgi:hypothetical protein
MATALSADEAEQWVARQQEQLRAEARKAKRQRRGSAQESWIAYGMGACVRLGLAPQINRDIWITAYAGG